MESFEDLFESMRLELEEQAEAQAKGHGLEPEDLVQECALVGWEAFANGGCMHAFRPWIKQILRNVVATALRKKSREPETVSLEDLDEGRDLDLAAQGWEESLALLNAVEKLKGVHGLILLTFLSGEEPKNLSERVRLTRARGRLKETLGV